MSVSASPARTDGWVVAGLAGLPLFGLLTLWSSLEPQPEPSTQYDAWARYVTTDRYVVGHLVGSGLGLIAAIFGTIALGVVLARTNSRTLGLTGAAVAIGGAALFLLPMGVSTFSAPMEGFAYLSTGETPIELPATLAGQLFSLTFLVVIVLSVVGNVLLGVAIWRSKSLPRWSGASWALAHIFMYPLGVIYALVVGVQSTPPTVPIGATIAAIAGSWIVWNALRRAPETLT